jgi:hypothetical protein
MAENGTRFNKHHVIAVCAHTRACQFTGRNTHFFGVSNIAEWPKKGEHRLTVEISKTDANSAIAQVASGDHSLAAMPLPALWPIYTPNSGVRCGENRHAPISRAYQPPFVFDQTLKRVTIDVEIG